MRIAIIGIAWFKREDYAALKRLSSDGNTFAATYDDWLQSAEQLIEKFRTDGQAFQKVYIDPNTFPAWCATRGLEVNSQARIRFANETVGGAHDKAK